MRRGIVWLTADPDDAGVYFSESNSAALAHRRLSIIDLSPLGHQPMTTDDGRFTIVHNGEVYNYAELINNNKLKIPVRLWRNKL